MSAEESQRPESPGTPPASPNDGKEEKQPDRKATDQSFVKFDDFALYDCIERRDRSMMEESFGGIDGITAALKSDMEQGVDPATVEARRKQFGTNYLPKREPATFIGFFIEACEDRIVQILAVAAVVSIVLSLTVANPHTKKVERETGWIEGFAIIISILAVTLTGSINNYIKAKKFEEMEQTTAITELSVTRGGSNVTIQSDMLVVGDIIDVEGGMALGFDGIVFQASDLKCHEAAITGEPDLISKTPDGNFYLLSGTNIDEGTGRALVVAVGMNAFQGRMKASIEGEENQETPLQEHLTDLADQIGYFGFAAAGILIIALVIKEIILIFAYDKEANVINFLNFFLVAVTLIAVAIPEGLPLAVTIALAFSMQAMAEDNCLVRILASCETMGAATTVASDKTGTLTKNEMTVVQGIFGTKHFFFGGVGLTATADECQELDFKAVKQKEDLEVPQNVLTMILDQVSANSSAKLIEKDGEVRWSGNPTEQSMLKFCQLLGVDFAERRGAQTVVKQYPFNSKKKKMTSILEIEGSDRVRLISKGASENVLADCDKYVDADGNELPLPDDLKAQFKEELGQIASQGSRTIGIAYIDIDRPSAESLEEAEPSVDMIWLGVFGIQDPLRDEVEDAVRRCGTAGITVRMVTGDNIDTAIAIAKKAGIFKDNEYDMAMLGPDFKKLAEHGPSDEEIEEAEKEGKEVEEHPEYVRLKKEILPRLKVVARSSPNDKLLLVKALQSAGEVVGVTGDGTNDAPALKKADVGFAMKTGTDIAKAAAHMVLLDDNFASVVNAVKWGRAVNDNVKKFLQFQLAINVAGVTLTIVGSLVSATSKEPFTPVQLLWLNLIMDTLAALSLSTERPEEASLTREPVWKQAPLITNRMRVFIGVHGIWQVIVIMVWLFWGHRWLDIVENRGLCLNDYDDINEMVFINGTTFGIPNTRKHPTQTYCEDLCKHEGGVLNDKNQCQQGVSHSTFIFNTFIWMQIFNVINARKIYKSYNPLEGVIDRSRNLIVIFLLIAGLQAIAVNFFESFMGVTRINGKLWGASVGMAFSVIVVGIIMRFVPVEDNTPEEIIERKEELQALRDQFGVDEFGNKKGEKSSVSSTKKTDPVDA